MRDDETSVSYYAARKMRNVQRVKNAWKKEVSRRRVSRETLAKCLREWREGKHELIVDKDVITEDWGIGKLRKNETIRILPGIKTIR
jgi:hypothetical protein